MRISVQNVKRVTTRTILSVSLVHLSILTVTTAAFNQGVTAVNRLSATTLMIRHAFARTISK